MITGQQISCSHQNFQAIVAVNRFEDSGRFMADITVVCLDCRMPFRFLGVPAGLRWNQPACSIDSTELHAPIEPADTPQIQSRATFQMPPELTARRES